MQTPEGSWQEVLELLAEHGFDGMAQAIETLFNEAMRLERSAVLEAQPYERTPRRRGYANGFKPKTVRTRVGQLELAVPQTRDVPFYPSALERGQRSERALKLAVAEMYLQGDIAFDPHGLVLGSNEREFWLAIKPGDSSYWWGQWSEANCAEKLRFSPTTLIEAIGLAAADSSESDVWSLSNEGVFDVLVKREAGRVSKKIYIYGCDYLVRRIEYFDESGEAVVVAELDKYKQVNEGFSVPTSIEIIRAGMGKKDDSAKISLGSIKADEFSEKLKNRYFRRPEQRGFEYIYKIDEDCEIIEQPTVHCS